MADEHPDLQRLIGPDRRSLPPLRVLVGLIGFVTLAALLALWPRHPIEVDLSELGVASQAFPATVKTVEEGPCEGTETADQVSCSAVSFELNGGPDEGLSTTQEFPVHPTSPNLEVGDRVVLNYQPEAGPEFAYQFADRERRPLLAWVALGFAAAVLALGRLRGFGALAGLLASLVILLVFVVPAILSGRDPVLVAAVAGAVIVMVALYLAHGFSTLTDAAALGALAALAVTAALSWGVVALARLSGLATEESIYLTLLPTPIDFSGLVLAGMVLGALGALDDVTVTQASAIMELKAANPGLSDRDLFAAGLRVGRDHVASAVNTLLLAYAGAALPLLLLFSLSHQPLGVIANSEVVATEIIRTLVGSIGLVSAVPLTTWLAARAASNR